MRGLDLFGLLPLPGPTHITMPSSTPPPTASRIPLPTPTHITPPPTPVKKPATPIPTKVTPVAPSTVQKAQKAAQRAINAGQKLSRHNSAAGNKLIAAGNAHMNRTQVLTARQQRGVMGYYIGQGPDPGAALDPQSDSVNAVAQLGELANQMLDWVQTLQQSGPQAAWKQVATAQRAAM